MTTNHLIFMSIGGFSLSILGLAICYAKFKWSLITKIDILVVYIANLGMFGTLLATYGNFSGLRFGLLCLLALVVVLSALFWYVNKILITPIHSIISALNNLSRGDFTQQLDIQTNDELGTISRRFNEMVTEVSKLINSMKNNSIDNFKKIEHLSDLSTHMTDASENMSQKSTIVASSAEEMNVNMNSIGVQPADVVIEPDVAEFGLSEFSRAHELAQLGRSAANQAIPKIRDLLRQVDAALF